MKQAFPILILVFPLLASPVLADDQEERAAAVSDIKLTFKVDPRLTSGVYGGERWISPSTYMGATAQHTVETKAVGIGANGNPIRINPDWIPSEPDMVTVSPNSGDAVTITVKRAGESRLVIKAQQISRDLAIKAASQNGFMQIEITQLDLKQPAPAAERVQPKVEVPSEAERALAIQQLAEKNKKDGEAFLAANKAKEGVVVRESGLQYKVVKAGDGPKPARDDVIVCRFRGTGIDGTRVGASYPRNLPMVMPLKRTMKGWQEAVQLMPVGSKWQVFIPPDLAYGERAVPRVGPNATLIFEIELVAIQNRDSANTYPDIKPGSPPEVHRRKGR
jgi:FKBP-type peptidyl-prolyl cis-trans isomerase